ncbi:MAG: PAS domain S-box protein [Desulfosoma sp.]
MREKRLGCAVTIWFVLTMLCGISEGQIVRVCTYDGFPLTFRDPSGKPSGLFVDILNEIAQKEKWSLAYRHDAWQNCLNAARDNDADLLVAIAETEDRRSYVRFSRETILVNWGVLFTSKDHPIESIVQLQNKKIAVLRGDVYFRPLADLLDSFRIPVDYVEAPSYDTVMTMLEEHQVDLGLVNRIYGAFAQNRYRVQSTPIVVHPVELKFAASLNASPMLCDIIDRYIKEWKRQENSFLQEVFSRWLQIPMKTPREALFQRYFYAALGGAFILVLLAVFLRKQVGHKARLIQKVIGQLTDAEAQRRAAEEALAEAEDWYRAVFQKADDALLVLDESGKIIECNPAATRLFQLRLEDFVGRTPMDFSPDLQPDGSVSRDRGRSLLEATMAGCPQRFGWQHKTPDGKLFDAEVQLSLLFQKGHARVLASVRDVSHQKALETERERHQKYLETVLDGIPVALFVIDLKGHVVFWNRMCETITGMSKEAVLTRPLDLRPILEGKDLPIPALLLLEMTPEDFLRSHPEWKAQPLPFHSEGIQLTGKILVHGEKRYVSVVAARLRNQNGELMGVVQCARDITHEIQMQKQLLHSQKMEAVGKLSGGIAHDFNNILTIILGYCDLMRKKADLDPMILKGVDEIEKTAERASNLTRQLLAFSRKQIMQPVALDLNRLIEDLAKMLERLVGEDIHIDRQLDENLWAVWADPVFLEQIILNLVINARDAMPSGGKLTIQTSNLGLTRSRDAGLFTIRPGEYVCLRVSDTGQGIDPEVQPRIFEPFFTTKPEGRGTGLGLATVYGIVKQLGGYILLESELGKGTTFDILLPRILMKPDETRQPPPLETPVEGRGSETILVVEDEEALRSMIEEVLAGSGYGILTASTGVEALDILRRAPDVDLVITDVVMPEMNGVTLSREIARYAPHVPILFTSGYADEHLAHRGILLPDVRFLAKPFTAQQLLHVVREVLKHRASKGSKGA